MKGQLPELLERIDQLREKADAFGDLPKETRESLDRKIRLDWTFYSNKMEGNSLDYGETKLVLFRNLTVHGKPLADALHLKGHYIALERLEKLVEKKSPLTETTIREFHRTIFQDPFEASPDSEMEAGEWKNTNNYLYNRLGERVDFTPHGDETIRAINALVNWTNNQFAEAKNYRKRKYRRQDFDLHPLVVSAEFHRRFVEIHPFLDGNGRTARLFSNLVLLRFGFPPIIVRTENLDSYYRALDLSKEADIEAFSVFMAERLIEALEFFISVAEGGPVEEQEDWEKRLALLKHEVGAEKNAAYRSEELLFARWEDSIKPLLLSVENKLMSFDSLFNKKKNNVRWLHERSDSFESILQVNKTYYQELIKSEGLQFRIKWIELINHDSVVDMNCWIDIEFFSFKYTFEYLNGNIKLEKSWDQILTEAEIKKFVNQVGKNVFDRIQQQKD